MGYIQKQINDLLGGGDIGTNSNPISYATFLRDRMKFQHAGGLEGDDFSQLDTPGHYFFKILFYFRNGDSTGVNGMNGGLLAPTWEEYEGRPSAKDYYSHNSAWSFLKMNNEGDRADLLKKFVILLSDISSNSPWYFKTISGLSGALKRESVGTDNFTIPAEKKQITIKCLPDAYDTRIATLLDLYRSVSWSWTKKCEILPRNLRKFDMGVYIFSSPITNLHKPDDTVLDIESSNYSTSYQLIEFHGCEIDYNSSSSINDELDNSSGQALEYTITIKYDDAYERRWNEGMLRLIGDVIANDTASVIGSTDNLLVNNKDSNYIKNMTEFTNRVNEYKQGLLKNMTDQLLEEYNPLNNVQDSITGIVLGNLNGFSLSKIDSQVEQLASGQFIQTKQNISSYTSNNKQAETVITGNNNIGKIFLKNNGSEAKAQTILSNL